MTDPRPALSNLMVCAVLQLQDQQPALFNAVGRSVSEPDAEKVFAYDVLSALTGRDFDACWDAMERASDAGLIDSPTTFQGAWLAPEGMTLLERSPLDIVGICRAHARRQDEPMAGELMDLIDALPCPPATPSRAGPPAETVLVVVSEDLDLDGESEDDEEDVVVPRRLRP